MDERLKCETGNHQNTRGEKRKRTLWPQLQQFLPWHVSKDKGMKTKMNDQGAPGWRRRLSVQLQPGHDLEVREFEPRVRLQANGSGPGDCFRFCVSLSLCPSSVHGLSLSVPKTNQNKKKKMNDQDLVRIKIFCTEKETISKIKRPPMKGMKIFANDILDRSEERRVGKEC